MQLTSICVFCGSSESIHKDYKLAAWEMGKTIAERDLTLIYGGGKTGLMGAMANGAISACGKVIGINAPSFNNTALAHNGLTHMEVSPNMHARKAKMYELADGFIALPGGFGTLDELFETITWGQIGEHEKPVGLLNVRGFYSPLLATIDHVVKEGFIFRELRDALHCASDPNELLDAMIEHEHPREAVKKWMMND